jgi:hypothetical protein
VALISTITHRPLAAMIGNVRPIQMVACSSHRTRGRRSSKDSETNMKVQRKEREISSVLFLFSPQTATRDLLCRLQTKPMTPVQWAPSPSASGLLNGHIRVLHLSRSGKGCNQCVVGNWG